MLLSLVLTNLKTIFLWMLELFRIIRLNWICIVWPILYGFALISDKYWGGDNKFEQIVEAINKIETGESVDISADLEKKIETNDLKKYIPSEK